MSSGMIIGITGGIGSGKSVMSRIIRLNGFPVYDCDSEARRIMHENIDVREGLCDMLGNEVYDANGNLDRGFMSRCIFTDTEKRKLVNSLVHNAVRKDFLDYCNIVDSPAVFCESAILSTSGFDSFCDAIWLVEASENIRIGRVIARNNLSVEEIRHRMKSQEGEFSKLPPSKTIAIVNDGNTPVLGFVLKMLEEYKRMEL